MFDLRDVLMWQLDKSSKTSESLGQWFKVSEKSKRKRIQFPKVTVKCSFFMF